MILSRILVVLLSLTVIVSCRAPQASSDTPWYREGNYRVKEISTVSSDGSILIELADDIENNGSNSGKNFWVPIRNITVDVDPSLSGTYIWIWGTRGADDEVDLSRIYKSKILVRKEEQRTQWDDFLKKQKDVLYGPRDVLPPEPNRPNR